MSFARKTTGLGALAHTLLVVDQDGASVVDLGINAVTQPTVNASCTYGTMTWAGVSRGYVQTAGSGSSPLGITWTANAPLLTHLATNGATVVFIGSPGNAEHSLVGTDARALGFFRDAVGNPFKAAIDTLNSGQNWNNSLVLTAGSDFSDKIILGSSLKRDNNWNGFADIDGGSQAALRFSVTDGANSSDSSGHIVMIGGVPAGGTHTVRMLCVAVFNNYAMTLSDYQALRNNWFGELIAADSTAPTYGVNPHITQQDYSTATFAATASDETASAVDHYMAVYSSGSTPTAANVKAGTGTGLIASSARSQLNISNGVQATFGQITANLSRGVSYRASFTVEEQGGGNLHTVYNVDFTMPVYRINRRARTIVRH